jgi:hypothetical protein
LPRRRRRFIPTTQPSYDAERDGNDGNNVIDAIERFEKVLADKSKPKEERAELSLGPLLHECFGSHPARRLGHWGRILRD